MLHILLTPEKPAVGGEKSLAMATASMLDMDEATNIEEEARRAARKRAIDRLAEDLQNPDQLSKVRDTCRSTTAELPIQY